MKFISTRGRLLASSMIVGATLLGATVAHAQESTEVEALVVTGSRIPQPNLTSVSPVQVVNSEEFRQQGQTDTVDMLNDLPMGMTAHIVVPAYDADAPSTQSARMISVIRREIGFQGLLLTDDLTMEALSGTLAERTARAIQAGCDVALHCNGTRSEMAEVAAAAGALTDAALGRADAALARRLRPDPIDESALLAELDAILTPARV